MLRSHTCGELRIENVNKTVTLSGWVQRVRDKGGLIWIDLRDRYGITQLLMEEGRSEQILVDIARTLGREFVIKAKGNVIERESKNPKMPTGEIEIDLTGIEILNASKTPPFTIEDETDGGEELRMKYRYLDLRRNPLRANLALRHRLSLETRKYLDSIGFFDIETPYLIKSTPEGARDFVV
ncbi:MAG: aspartate--tRNA ligase, partial [Candidatus Heimdallarchaeota archaeon]|nr:aspartate--tRNA ligase [Candidatus Heimdallarchaeota archaeon]